METNGSLGPGFRALLLGSLISNIGDGIRLAALPLLAASLTSSPLLIASVTAAQYLPWVTFGLVGARWLIVGIVGARSLSPKPGEVSLQADSVRSFGQTESRSGTCALSPPSSRLARSWWIRQRLR